MSPTSRRPPGVPVSDWVDQQVREAQAAGAFDDLPGAGRPIPDLHRQDSSLRWALRWAEREGADLSLALPPALALRRERAALRAELPQLTSEAVVRELVADFNERLRRAYLRPTDHRSGPALAVAPLDVDGLLEEWRVVRPPPPPPPAPPPAPRRWWRHRR